MIWTRSFHTILILELLSGVAFAQSSEVTAAQALFDEAKRLMANGNLAEACPKLEESQKLDPALGTVLNLADCYERDGRLASAWSHFVEAEGIARGGGHLDAESVARDRASRLAAVLSNVVIEVEPEASTPGLEITRDGVVVGPAQWGVPIPADRGVHVVKATAPGKKNWDARFEVSAQGATVTIRVRALDSEPTPNGSAAPSANEAQSVALTRWVDVSSAHSAAAESRPIGESSWKGTQTAAVALGGLGIAASTAAVIEWLTFERKKDEATLACPTNACMSPQYENALAYRHDEKTALAIGAVATVLSSASLAGALILWFTTRTQRTDAKSLQVAPTAGGHEIGIRIGAGW